MNAIIKLIFTLELLIAFKMAYFCCFSLGGNLNFPEFLQKKFYNINYSVTRLGEISSVWQNIRSLIRLNQCLLSQFNVLF